MKYQIVIADFNNRIVQRLVSETSNKTDVIKILNSNGYNVTLRRDANHYASVCVVGSDYSELNLWLTKI